MSTTDAVAGVVLAAGAGKRYGMPKVLAEEGDWLRRAVAALAGGGCADVVVVLGAATVEVPAPARPVIAMDWAAGMSASLRTGLDAVSGAAYIAVHLVDTPDIGADVVQRVLAAASTTGLARAHFGGRPGHPVVMSAAHSAALRSVLTGDQGARAYLAGRDDIVAVECADLATGADIDEPTGG